MGSYRRSVLSTMFFVFVACGGGPLDCQPPNAGDLGTFTVTETLVSNTCGVQASESFPVEASYTADIALDDANGVFKWTPASGSEVDGTYDTTTGAFNLESTNSTEVVAPSAAMGVAGCVIDQTDVIQGVLEESNGDGGYEPLLLDAGGNTIVDTGVVDTGVDAGVVDTGVDTGVLDTSVADAGDAAVDANVSNGQDAGSNIDAGLTAVDAGTPAPVRIVFSGTHQIVIAGESSGDCSSQVGGSPGQYDILPCMVTYTITGVLQ